MTRSISKNETKKESSYESVKSVRVEEVCSGFAPLLKANIYADDNNGLFIMLDLNQKTNTGLHPVKYWNYDTLLLLRNLITKTLDRTSWWYFELDRTATPIVADKTVDFTPDEL